MMIVAYILPQMYEKKLKIDCEAEVTILCFMNANNRTLMNPAVCASRWA